jgi:hypothetical protein
MRILYIFCNKKNFAHECVGNIESRGVYYVNVIRWQMGTQEEINDYVDEQQ